jgi:hypothetical protein
MPRLPQVCHERRGRCRSGAGSPTGGRGSTVAESMAATSSVVPGNAFEDLNSAEARRIAGRGAEIARSAGFEAEPRGELASATGKGSSALPTSSTPP